MRHQTGFGRLAPAGSSRDERLDPFTLPAHFTLANKTADAGLCFVELSRERVLLRRMVRGMKMAVNVPVSAYFGIALRMEATAGAEAGDVLIVLEHRDPALSLLLCQSDEGHDVVADWQSWGRVLGLPLLVAEADGRLREPFARIGALRVAAPNRRRRRRSTIRMRRPAILLRRKSGRRIGGAIVHDSEREIIARN